MSIFERVAYQIGQKAASNLGGLSGLAQFGLNVLQNRAAGRVKAGHRALIGGISRQAAREIFEKAAKIDYAKKNLWHINVANLRSGQAPDVNFYATDVSYADTQVQGAPVPLGSGHMDTVETISPVELRITSMDDVGGSIKTWFNTLRLSMARPDGTFGLPLDYLVRITIHHAFIEDADNSERAYVDSFIMRPGGIEKELSRREDGLQELQLSFVQFDSFTNLV